MDLEVGPSCFGDMSSTSHRNIPLALLSKIKRRLSKSPSTRDGRDCQQPIEHQYLPIPTVSISESLRAQSTYSCSNHSSSDSSFIFIDHDEGPESFEFRPFVPLIIQHERLQQRLAPPLLSRQRKRNPPPNNEPPSPTSTMSSKSPITPIFTSFLRTDVDDLDDIVTLSSSDIGSISEYSLPRSLTAYMEEEQSRGRKSSLSNSESESRRGRRGIAIPTPSPLSYASPTRPTQRRQHLSKKSFPPATSPPPSRPLPEPPVSVRGGLVAHTITCPDVTTTVKPDTPFVVSDPESGSVQNLESAIDSQLPLVESSTSGGNQGRVSAIMATSGLSELEILRSTSTPTAKSISTSPSPSMSTAYYEFSTSSNEEDQEEEEKDQDCTSTYTRTSISTPTTPTPRQYGIGRQVIRGSGCDFGCGFGDLSGGSNRDSRRMSSKRQSSGMRRLSAQESAPESASGSKLESVKDGNGEGGEKSNEPVGTAGDDVNLEVQQVATTTTPSPGSLPPRRRVRSDDTTPSINPSTRRRTTTHREKPRDKINSEWTLFLGVPRNAPPPALPTTVLPVNSGFASSSASPPLHPEPNHAAVPKLRSASSIPATAPTPQHLMMKRSQNQTFLPPPTITTMLRNRTKSDSALLVTAASAPSGRNTEHNGNGNPKTKTKTKSKRGREDWTLSLPLIISSPSSLPAVSSSASSVMSGSGEGEDSKTGLVITVEDVDGQQGQQLGVRRSGEEEEEDQNSLTLRVPRIVRSCSSSPLLSTSTNANSRSNRMKQGSKRWMGASSTPNLRTRGTTNPGMASGEVGRLSSSTLEQEVMFMLLGNAGNDDSGGCSDTASAKEEDDGESNLVDLAKKKMATLDEDLARFNALLKNGNESRLSSAPIETAAATTTTKTKTVTLNSHPIPSTPPKKPIVPSSSQSLSMKPVLKLAKSCEPFLESHSSLGPGAGSASGGAGLHPPPPSHMGPVMRFPSSTGNGDLNFFDDLGNGDGFGQSGFKPTGANLRLTRSAEWIVPGDSKLLTTTSLPETTMTATTATSHNASLPIPTISTSSRASPPPHRNSTSSNSSSTQTLLLPFASTPSSSSSSLALASAPAPAPASSTSVSQNNTKSSPASAFNLKSEGGVAKLVVPMPLKNSPVRTASMGSLRTTPLEPCVATSHKSQKQKAAHLPRLHTSSLSSSSSSCSSSFRHHHIMIPDIYRRSNSPPPLPSPVPSESSSVLPTPLASAFPLPPCSTGILGCGGIEAFQEKMREFECVRDRHMRQRGVVNCQDQEQQRQHKKSGQQQQQERNQYQSYKPPSTASSISSMTSLVSNASSTATVVPCGDRKLKVPGMMMDGGLLSPSSAGAGVQVRCMLEDDDEEDSMCSGTYYTARSSFSNEGV